MMQTKSDDLINEGQYKLAHTMLQRCVAFYDGLGQKWLGRMRKCRARCDLHNCVKHLDGLQAAEAQMQSAKNTAERELGSNHPTTLAIAWDVSPHAHTHTHTQYPSVHGCKRTHLQVTYAPHVLLYKDRGCTQPTHSCM